MAIIIVVLGTCALALFVWDMYLLSKLQSTKRTLRNEIEEKHQAQLSFLNLQTKPHFLTNCLSIIYSLTLEKENELALKMISYLSKEMQYRFATRGSFVTVRDEIARVENYLNILQIRYPDAIEVEYQIDNRTLDSYVSPFSLQPLVDNCIKHGRISGQSIHIGISCLYHHEAGTKYLALTVTDDGRGIPQEKLTVLNDNMPREWKLKVRHVGIENLKFRLFLLYGAGNTKLSFSSKENAGTSVTLILPDKPEYQLPEEDDDE